MYFDNFTLEFDKVLQILASFACSNYSKDKIINTKISNNARKIITMLDEVEEARESIVKYGSIPLAGLCNEDDIVKRIRLHATLSISDFLALKNLLSCCKNVIAYYKNNLVKNKDLNYLNYYFDSLNPLKNLYENISGKIDDDGEINDNASPQLFEIRKKIKQLDTQVRAKMQELLHTKAKMLNESLVVIRNGRMCLCVKAEFKNVLKGIIHDESASRTTVYIEPFSALEISNKIVGLKEEEKIEINRILSELSVQVFKYEEEIKTDFYRMIDLDIIFAKATYAIKLNAFKPTVNELGIIDIKRARHPLIDSEKCVPIDIKLGQDYEAIIITGPNTGGKTVALKTTGLLTMMMQSGMLIPASSGSNLAVFDNVFADIGDEQSIEQSLSSFSAHMKKVINIINNLTSNSLVLLDELGSGTDPKEGSNIAISVVEYLIENHTRVIVTTHYADLKAFAYNRDNIINASVEFDTETLKPTYKLLLGIPGRSNAITIAKSLGLKESIINRSLELNTTDTSDVSLMLGKLDEQNSKLTNEINFYETENEKLKIKIKELNEKEQKLTNEYDSYIKKAKEEANKILEKAKEDALNLILELEDKKKQLEFKEHEVADLKNKARNLVPIDEEDNLAIEFKVGDMVYVKPWQRNGKIMSINKDKYEVQIGNFYVSFKKNELSIAKNIPNEIKKPVKKKEVTEPKNSGAKLECDLRGFRYEEVALELDKFIDQAYLAGLNQIYIIHGFGTGAVRKAVQEYLKKCPYVTKTRYGGEGEGLNGVTVAYLK